MGTTFLKPAPGMGGGGVFLIILKAKHEDKLKKLFFHFTGQQLGCPFWGPYKIFKTCFYWEFTFRRLFLEVLKSKCSREKKLFFKVTLKIFSNMPFFNKNKKVLYHSTLQYYLTIQL